MTTQLRVTCLCLSLLLGACGEGVGEIEGGPGDDAEAVTGELAGCNEGNCLCFNALAQVMNGHTPDPRYLNNLGGDPAAVFSNGGSENIALTCRTVHYWAQNNPDPTWLEQYFELQLAPGTPSLFGGEIFSATYSSLMVGDAIAVLARARQRGHAALVEKASRYLEAYFTGLALGSVDAPVNRLVAYNRSGRSDQATRQPGLTVGLVGTRSYVQSHNDTGLQGVLLAMALEHPRREARWDLTASPGYYGGLRAAVEVSGYQLSPTGRVTLASRSVPASVFGLTEARRAALLAMLSSGGTAGGAAALAVLQPYQFSCELTVLRTSGGVISWWGRSDGSARPCNGRKGGSWAMVKLETSGTLTVVTRSSDTWGGGDMGTVWREGSTICAESSTLPRLCLPVPGGAIVSELVLGPTGARCVSGACGGGVPPPLPPPPAQGTLAAVYVSQVVPGAVARGSRFAVQVTLRNTGTARWSQAGGVRLGSQAPTDNLVWGVGRVDLPAGLEIAPGASHTFSFQVTAPATAGTRPFQWKLLREGVTWFGPATPVVNVTVQ